VKTIIVTGATSGIGLAVCRALALQGEHVIGIGRDGQRCEASEKTLREAVPGAEVKYFCADLMQQNQVLRVADELCRYLDGRGAALDVLINNAGGVRSWYATTEEGYEQQFALNHLAGFLLTWRLMPYLKRVSGRVIFTGSASHKHMKIHWNDIMFKRHYSCLMAYKQTKLCNMLFAGELNRRYRGEGVRAYVVDPGLVHTEIGCKQTGGIVSWFWGIRSRRGIAPQEAAGTYVYLCNADPAPEALYLKQCRAVKYGRRAADRNAAENLFQLSERLCGVHYS